MRSEKKENPLISITFNIIIPVAVLEQLSKRLGEGGPTIALILALSFPVAYGAWDYMRNHHKNYVSLLGIVNILFTGGFALMQLEGIWFAVKEAGFPLILGLGVFISSFTKTPFMKVLAYNPNVLNTELIEEKLKEGGKQSAFDQHLKNSTHLLTLSFMISAALNFFLARRIFVNIDSSLSKLERTGILNEQIAEMTWLSFVVIMIPLMLFMMIVMWHLLAGIKKMTGLQLNDILPAHHQPETKTPHQKT
jgi:hypothetical protein